ncbi:MAG TPA: hypothetical protein VNK70_00125 [Candidatus Paceibacterota bacterium]|nr:hypothetical protein [Candidatus Paceibacterota bacterium]
MLGIVKKLFLERKTVAVLLVAAALVTIFSLVLVIVNIGDVASPVLIHFDKFRGIDSLGEKSDIWEIWFGGAVLLVINSVLSGVFYTRERSLSYVFAAAALIISLLNLVVLGLVFSVN